jgi:hypothetical protein
MKKKSIKSIYLIIFLSFVNLHCSQNKTESYPWQNPAVVAPANISSSFKIKSLKQSHDLSPTEDQAKIRINKASLEKEFLWQAQFIEQLSAPQFHGLKSRVVTFRKHGENLYLLESTQGHTVTNEIPQALVLAAFPITNENESEIEFDFNKGMSEIYTADEWRASDFDGAAYQNGKEFLSVDIRHSYIESAKLNDNNVLEIIQHAQATVSPSAGNMNTPIETKHYFSPYISNPNYSPIKSVNFDRMGFFEVAPQLNIGSKLYVFASRFDPDATKSITYAVSSNTPAEFKDAVKEGALYWNKAFGYEKIKVIDAPAGITAPDPNYNVIQWVSWDSAGAAYADAQADPRTGEILHAQIFMTSAFSFAGKFRARQLLRTIESNHGSDKTMFSLAGIRPSKLCDLETSDSLKELLSSSLEANLPDSQILEISRDYIRETVAHEVGHTLGLRHNFAGSLGGNFELSKFDSIFEKYLKTLELPAGLKTSSSVMDYQFFSEAAVSGRSIHNGDPSDSYDQMAINVLYKNTPLDIKNTPLFCTDSLQGKAIGCIVWDQGPSPLADKIYTSNKAKENLPRTVIETFIKNKTLPFDINPISISETQFEPKLFANSMLAHQKFTLELLTQNTKVLKVMRSFVKLDGTTDEELKDKTIEANLNEINSAGGLQNILSLPSASLAANWTAQFNALIDSPVYRAGTGVNGSQFTFTDDEVNEAKLIAADLFQKIQKKLILNDISSLSKDDSLDALADTTLSDDFASVLFSRMNEYLLNESGEFIEEKIILDENKSATIRLPIFKYDKNVRILASQMMSGHKTVGPDWAMDAKNDIKLLFSNKIKSVLMGNDISKIPLEKNSRKVVRWIIENNEIMSKLGGQANSGPGPKEEGSTPPN